jgi:phosphoenolpyruvate carboxylase
MSVNSEILLGAVYKAASVVGNSTVPFEGHLASGWNSMTDNYSKFTIATIFSGILHEASYKILRGLPQKKLTTAMMLRGWGV